MTHPHHAATPRLRVIGSGSSGNCLAIVHSGRTILIDAGFSARETLRRLDIASIETTSVAAIVLTHEHGDHVSGVRVLAKRLEIPVYASPGTRKAGRLDEIVTDPRDLMHGSVTTIAGMDVIAFRTSHDATDPVGLRIECGDTVIGVATDTGEITHEAREALRHCDILGLESNHDVDMLTNGPYPWFLKQRILSARGHLSNDDAARALESLAETNLSEVIGLHLSTTNNEARHAMSALKGALGRLDHSAAVSCARQGIEP